jgi:hypothetical protein
MGQGISVLQLLIQMEQQQDRAWMPGSESSMFRLGLVVVAASAFAVAQQGGTFETSAPTQVVPASRPVITTPTLTLSNGFSPATVNMPQTLVSEQPQQIVTGMPQSEEYASGASVNASEPSASDSNFGSVEQQSAFGTDTSLGEMAKKFGHGKVQPHKTYSNEDIDRLNEQQPSNGIISANFANGQPITDRNQDGFTPMSGIANMPDVGNEEGTQVANGDEANPMSEGQGTATASNADQGQEPGDLATTPSAEAQQPANGNDANQQSMPASDQPHR